MKKIVVVVSTYNGSKYITRQLDSIFNQKGVEVVCLVRDDGSTDNTVDLLKHYLRTSANNEKLFIIEGTNIGWERSFMHALKEAPNADYYAFSDQDDIWFEDKLQKAVTLLNNYDYLKLPLLYHCNKLSVNKDLVPYKRQIKRISQPLNRQNAMIQEFAQGCSIVLNNKAREIVTMHIPIDRIAHDFWCGMICYMFGKVLYDNEKNFFHINHETNASNEGHTFDSWLNRFYRFFTKDKVYYYPYDDLLIGYNHLLTEKDIAFINKVKNYKKSLSDKFCLFLSMKFVRASFLGTISLKVAILLNKL